MALLDTGLCISKSLLNIFISLSYMSLMHASLPTTAATSRLGGNETDRLSLLAFKDKITNDPLQVMHSWNGSIHFCRWHGVTCGHRHQRVVMLVLQSQKLFGTLSPHIGNLSFLRVLDLRNNSLEQEIPPEIGGLRRLQNLALHNNSLSGKIPANLSACSNLQRFNFACNRLVGAIPAELGFLSKVSIIFIFNNYLTGEIPHSFQNLSSLNELDASANNLGGSIPDAFGQLPNLNYQTSTLFHLRFLSSLTNATDLRILAMGENNFGGMFPKSVTNYSTKLEIFIMSNNHIFGNIPDGFGNLISLKWLDMWNNQFTGNIPNDIGRLQNLNELNLALNNFSGYIPYSLGNLSVLSKFSLENNNLHGSIPSSIEKCQNLLLLDLSNNSFNGTIPSEIFSLSSLSVYLDLSHNHFTGSLSVEIGKLKNLGILDVANNMLSGEIPSTVGSCVRLERLFMDGNFFQGSIPSSLSSLRGIQFLDLSRNNLSGKIPEYFEGFELLENFNLSYNDLEGEVPIKGVFANATSISVTGNSKLCGGIPELYLPRCNFKGSTKRGSILALKLIIPIASGLLGLALLLCILFVYWRKKKREKPSSGNSGSLFLKVSYQSLHKATNGFSKSNLIGVGSFGSVYEGFLEQEGKKVAVKVLNLLRPGASKSFIAECEALRNIRHRNLVKVITACSSVDGQNNDFKALVYEFVVNGSLDEWLHPIQEDLEADEEARSLSLVQRLNIAIDVACALDYLHHHCQTVIIHCDLKPNNVLLDDEMTAHVGDFGLAKFLLDANYSNTSNQTSSIGIRGSIGYAPPEYGMGSEVSTSGDVYSYGILLLEMFTGKGPTDEMFSDGLNLHNYAKKALPDRVVGIAYSILLQQGEQGETSTSTSTSTSTKNTLNQSPFSSYKIQECLASIFRIGIACSEESPTERLDISDVVAKLHVIRNNLLGTREARAGRTNELQVDHE